MYNHTESVFLAILFYALNNVGPMVLVSGLHPLLGMVLAVVPWILVFVLEKMYGKNWFAGQSDRE